MIAAYNEPLVIENSTFPEIQDFSWDLALRYLEAPAFGFDTETDARNYHWSKEDGDEDKTDRKRGLSYVADVSYISLFATGLPMMVVRAGAEQISYTADVVTEHGTIEERPFQRYQYTFSDDVKDFIYQLFMRDTPYTAVAHNAVFDMRQIIGKFLDNARLPETATIWDTATINLLGRWRPIKHKKDKISLAVLEEHYEILSPSERKWWKEMKTFRDKLHRLGEDTEEGKTYRKRIKRYLLYPGMEDPGTLREKNGWSLEEGRRAAIYYSGLDAYVAHEVYLRQLNGDTYVVKPTERFPFSEDFVQMLITDLAYTKWCAQACARGVKADVKYMSGKRQQYLSELVAHAAELGFGPDQVFAPRKDTWRENYILGIIDRPTEDETARHPYLLTKTGNLSFCAEAMDYYIQTHQELKLLRGYIETDTKYKKVDEWMRHAELDGRIHTNIDRFTVTGRSSSSTPNLQNPKTAPGLEETVEDTDCGHLIGDEGFWLVELDYSNAENWMQALYGTDNIMAYACAQEDFHSANAARYFPDQWEKADAKTRKYLRTISKPVTFSIPYGTGVKKLATSLSVDTGQVFTVGQAQDILDARNRAYQAAALAQGRAKDFADNFGYTTLWTGRRVSILQYEGHFKGYTAWNSLCQGGVGEMVVRAILKIDQWLYENGYKSQLLLQIHDSIILNLALDEYESVIPQVIKIMSQIMPTNWNTRTTPAIRWLTDVDHSSNAKKWGYVHDKEYPWPLDEYVNEWGFHKLQEGQKERPVWINEWGWGDRALKIELGQLAPDEEAPEQNEIKPMDFEDLPFDWSELELLFTDARQYVKIYHKGKHSFGFSEGIELQRALCHRGQESIWPEAIAAFDRLSEAMVKYRQWRELGGGKC